ncbi:MAG: hypothetical protein HFF87_04890 [Oscillibacter sp.]|nr:hypothetical protein [Oscillibacter sp.]
MKSVLLTTAGGGKIKLPEDADIRKMLLPGETLLWQGQPEEGAHWHFSLEVAVFLVVGTVMLLVSGSFFAVVLFSDAPIFFFLFSLPFFLVGIIFIAIVIFHPFFQAKRLARCRYAVTDRRILSMNSKNLFAYQIQELAGLNVKIYQDGRGTIYMERRWRNRRTIRYIFEEIPDAKRVFQLIERQRAGI